MENSTKMMIGAGIGIAVGFVTKSILDYYGKKNSTLWGVAAGSATALGTFAAMSIAESCSERENMWMKERTSELARITRFSDAGKRNPRKFHDPITGYDFETPQYNEAKDELSENACKGSLFDVSELSPDNLRIFKIAIAELKKTARGNIIIKELEGCWKTIKIVMNNDLRNFYDSKTQTVYWNFKKNLMTITIPPCWLDSITLLGHELGHAWQDLVKHTLGSGHDDEQENIEKNEHPIAKERKNYLRKSHEEILVPRYLTLPEFF